MPQDPAPCRLCGASTRSRFTHTIIKQHTVEYYECLGCHSLQTEEPYWLEQAYANDQSVLDVGRAQRNVLVAMVCAYLLERVRVDGNAPCLDWAGAEGLFCRLMRDRGFNFWLYDKFIRPLYAIPYAVADPLALNPVALTAFEYLEHLAQPREELGTLFGLKPRLVVATTELYSGQGEDWHYLSLHSGRHVFFYSSDAMSWIGAHFGYQYFAFPFVHVFVSNEVWERADLAEAATAIESMYAARESLFADAARSLIAHLSNDPWRHVGADFMHLKRTQPGLV